MRTCRMCLFVAKGSEIILVKVPLTELASYMASYILDMMTMTNKCKHGRSFEIVMQEVFRDKFACHFVGFRCTHVIFGKFENP